MGETRRRGRGKERGIDGSQGIDSALRRGRSDVRGQAHVLGFVLLIGAVTVASVGIVVFGTDGLDAQQTAIETEHAEQSMLEFTHATSTATVAGGDRVPVSIDAVGDGTIETREDAGRVRIVRETASGSEVLYDESLGVLRYTNGDIEIASQGGGLWRSDGTGTVSVSSPPLVYRDETLTFPIVRLTDARSGGDGVDGVVRQSGSPAHVDLRRHNRSVGGGAGVVRIEIESAYCDGWEREIEATVPGRVTERCTAGRADRMRFELLVPPAIGTVDSAIAAHEVDVHRNAPQIDGDVRADSVDEERVNGSVFETGYDYPSADAYVDALVEGCEEEGFDDLDREITEPGRYCVDTIDDAHTFDTSDGDIEVVVRNAIGDPNYQDELRVEGENDLLIAVDGPVSARGDAVIGNVSNPGQTQLFVSANGTVTTVTGEPTLAALVYAPDSNASVQGTPTVEGSIVADHVDVGNIRPGGIAYDDRIAAADIVSESGSHLRYFDVTAYELTIDD